MIIGQIKEQSLLNNLRWQIDPFLLRAIATGQGELTLDNVYKAVLENDMQLWVIFDEGTVVAACVTTILSFPSGKRVARTLLLGGNKPLLWGETLNDWLNEWAKLNGCHAEEAFVTTRMMKHLTKTRGYKLLYHVVGRNLWNESGVLH